MLFKIQVSCPDDDRLIERIIDAASQAGAGASEHYSRVAFISKGYTTWRAENGAHPNIGKIGEITIQPSAKVEMVCEAEKLNTVIQAIRFVHPYEEPIIDVARLEDF